MLYNPVGINEFFKLELSRVWEPWIVQALKSAVKIEEPDLVFLMETKLLEDAMKGKKYEVRFTQGLIVPSDGKTEGLALLWK